MAVDAVVRPGLVLELRLGRFGHRLKGPEPAGGLEIELLILRRGLGTLTRIRCAHCHPFFKISHLLGGQAFLGWHLQLGIGITDRLDQKALAHLPRDDRRAAVATFLPAALPIQSQPALHLLILAVALVTFAHQHGPDFFLKKLQPRRIGRPSGGCRQKNKCHKTLHAQKSMAIQPKNARRFLGQES